MPNRRKMPLPKSNATSSRRVAPTQARPDQAGLVLSAGGAEKLLIAAIHQDTDLATDEDTGPSDDDLARANTFFDEVVSCLNAG